MKHFTKASEARQLLTDNEFEALGGDEGIEHWVRGPMHIILYWKGEDPEVVSAELENFGFDLIEME